MIPKFLLPAARLARTVLFNARGAALMAARRLRGPSPKGTVALMSLGGTRGSLYLARAAWRLGYDVHVFSPDFPTYESRFSAAWTKADLINNYEADRKKVAAAKPKAVLVEYRNIFLPAVANLHRELGLRDFGDISHRTSNSKSAFRKAIDDAGLANLKWCTLDDYAPGKVPMPFVVKPDKGTGSRGVTFVETPAGIDEALAKREALRDDPTIGGPMVIEQFIEGRQFDVEGVAFDGEYHILTLTEEHYERTGSAFPSSWFLFSPPIDPALQARLFERVKKLLKALGVVNGGFHVESRIGADGEIYPIDYSNRMGYPELVSAACGYSFLQLYVKTMTGEDWTPPVPKFRSIYQTYIMDAQEWENMKRLLRTEKDCLEDVRTSGAVMAGVYVHGRIALRTETFDEMLALLRKYDLVPKEWKAFYGVTNAG